MVNLLSLKDSMDPLTKHRPIAALPFSGRYRIVDFILSSISHANIESVAMFISGSGRSIYDHVRSGREWDLDSTIRGGLFTFSQQYWKGEHYKLYDKDRNFYEDHIIFLEKSKDEYIIIQSGEVIHTLDINDMAEKHKIMGGDVTLAYSVQDTGHEGFHLKGDEILAKDTSVGPKIMSLDVFFMKIDTLLEILEKANADQYFASVNDVIIKYLPDYNLKAYEYRGFCAKIHSTQEFFDVNMSMLKDDNYQELFYNHYPIITRARSGPPTYYGENSKVKNAQIATGSLIYGSVTDSLIFRKVQVGENSKVQNSIILTGTKIGNDVKLNYVLIDKDVVIEDGVELSGTKEKALVIQKGAKIRKGAAL